MPYDPKALTEDHRSFGYKMMWFGLPLSLITLATLVFEPLSRLAPLTGGFVCGLFIAQAWSWSNDEFVQKEIAFASGWALCFAGLALFVTLIPITRDQPFDTGIVLAIMATIFHAAILFYRIRNGAFAGAER